jgi:EmrB/QacA subfamily drug resistance transporter
MAADTAPTPQHRARLVTATVSLAALSVTLNLLVVNVAFGAMSSDLHSSLATIQWVSTGYVLGLMAAVSLSGWLSSRLGEKRLLVLALVVFCAASMLSAIAWSADSLIILRIVSGAAGGIVPPLAHTIVVRASGGLRLATMMSILNGPVLAAPILGPTIAGVLVSSVSWRPVFLVGVVPAAISLALALRVLPADEPGPRRRLDLAGFGLLSPGLVLLVFGLAQLGGRSADATLEVVTALGLGTVLTALFLVHAGRLGAGALLDVRSLRRRVIVAPMLVASMFNIALFGSAAILPLYFELARGESATFAGLMVAVQGIGSGLGMLVCGRLTDRFGARLVTPIAGAVALVGTLPWAHLGPHTSYALLLGALIVRGAGLSALMNAAYAVAYGTLERDVIPSATAALNIVSRVSAAAGVAVLVALLDSQVQITGAVRDPATVAALADAFSELFVVLSVVAGLSIAAALLIPRGRTTAVAVEAI